MSGFKMVVYHHDDGMCTLPPPVRLHVLNTETDMAHLGIEARTVKDSIIKLKAVADFINEFLASYPMEKLKFDINKGVFFWPSENNPKM